VAIPARDGAPRGNALRVEHERLLCTPARRHV